MPTFAKKPLTLVLSPEAREELPDHRRIIGTLRLVVLEGRAARSGTASTRTPTVRKADWRKTILCWLRDPSPIILHVLQDLDYGLILLKYMLVLHSAVIWT